MTELGQAALSILAQGFPVFPVEHQSKKPLVKWQVYQNKLPTEEEVKSWWKKWPDANIGMATGELSGLVVVDCDTPEATEQFFQDHPDVANTLQSQTGRGGHFYFQFEPGIRNSSGILGQGIDVRAEG